MGVPDDWRDERTPLEETAFYRVATDTREGSLADVGWALYFSALAILVIARPAEWPASAILAVIALSAIVAVCRRRHIVLSWRTARAAAERSRREARTIADLDEVPSLVRGPSRTAHPPRELRSKARE